MSVLLLLARLDAFLSFVNRVVNFVDCFFAITTFVGAGTLEIRSGLEN
jgi:hypothetical protein